MKKINIATCLLALIVLVAGTSSCFSKRKPGLVYMPDMAYSRAYETYAERDSSLFTTDQQLRGGSKIFYDAMPVTGTIKRGELFPYALTNDSIGHSKSQFVRNPVEFMTDAEMEEAKRLYNINCAICHGEKGLGDGPLSASGKIGGVANFTAPTYLAMADGTMFHAVTYGKGVMGSYASQLNRLQRWQVIKYIKTLQGGKATAASATADTSAKKSVTADTTVNKI